MHHYTIPLNDDQAAMLADIAAGLHVTPEQVAGRALESYLSYERDFREQVMKGLSDAERGEFVPEEEMDALFDELIGRADSI